MSPLDDECSVAPEQDDPDAVRREYADETGLSCRIALWARRTGPQPQDIAFDAVVAVRPRRVIEVGCGRGEFAQRLLDVGIEVVALDQSPRMIELTVARGVDARIGDVQELPFDSRIFEAAVANFMLYHVPDVDRALSELARVLRPGGRLVAATNGVRQLAELWELVGRDLSDRQRLFMLETGERMLRRHFKHVRRINLDSTVELTAEEMRDYVAHSVAHKHLSHAFRTLKAHVSLRPPARSSSPPPKAGDAHRIAIFRAARTSAGPVFGNIPRAVYSDSGLIPPDVVRARATRAR